MRDWGGLVGRNGADVGTTWVVCGVGWVRAGERMAREGDVFFGYWERVGRVWARGCGRGVGWGVLGPLPYQIGERKAMAVGSG